MVHRGAHKEGFQSYLAGFISRRQPNELPKRQDAQNEVE